MHTDVALTLHQEFVFAPAAQSGFAFLYAVDPSGGTSISYGQPLRRMAVHSYSMISKALLISWKQIVMRGLAAGCP